MNISLTGMLRISLLKILELPNTHLLMDLVSFLRVNLFLRNPIIS